MEVSLNNEILYDHGAVWIKTDDFQAGYSPSYLNEIDEQEIIIKRDPLGSKFREKKSPDIRIKEENQKIKCEYYEEDYDDQGEYDDSTNDDESEYDRKPLLKDEGSDEEIAGIKDEYAEAISIGDSSESQGNSYGEEEAEVDIETLDVTNGPLSDHLYASISKPRNTHKKVPLAKASEGFSLNDFMEVDDMSLALGGLHCTSSLSTAPEEFSNRSRRKSNKKQKMKQQKAAMKRATSDKNKRRVDPRAIDHNLQERIRRLELAECFKNLGQLVPSLSDCPKPAKIAIIGHSVVYIKQLEKEEKNLSLQLKACSVENKRLCKRLSQDMNSQTIKNSKCKASKRKKRNK